MGRRTKRAKRNQEREQNALHSQVRLDGQGEDPIIRAMLKEIRTASHERSFELMTAVQAHIRGEPMDIQDPELRAKIAKTRERLRKKDEAEARFDEDPVKFVNDVVEKSKKLHPTKADKERDQAKGAKMYQQAYNMARAIQANKRSYIMSRLKNDPQEDFFVRGTWEMRGSGDNQQQVQLPDVIRLDGIDPIVCKPGMRKMPKILADILRQRYQDQDVASARDAALGSYRPQTELQRELHRIDQQYGEKSLESMPTPAIAT